MKLKLFGLLLLLCGHSALSKAANKDEVAVKDADSSIQYSYAYGANMASFMLDKIKQFEEFGIDLDKEAFEKGIQETLVGQGQLTPSQVSALLNEVNTKVRELSAKKVQEVTLNQQSKGKAFLEENRIKPGVVETNTGLQYEVIRRGSGRKPTVNNTVVVHYHGTLIDGTVFDSSVKRNQPATFRVSSVIPGWTEGLQLMELGAKYRFFIRPELAYGARAAGSIPPHSTLIFDVELLQIKP